MTHPRQHEGAATANDPIVASVVRSFQERSRAGQLNPAAVGAAHAGGAHGCHSVFGTAETRDAT